MQCFAHSLSDSYLELHFDNTAVSGHWQIAVRDLELAIGLDSNADSQVSWGELQAKEQEIQNFANSKLIFQRGDNACTYTFGTTMLSELNAGMFVYHYLDSALTLAQQRSNIIYFLTSTRRIVASPRYMKKILYTHSSLLHSNAARRSPNKVRRY